MDSIDVETGSSARNTLSGFPMVDRHKSWENFESLSREGSSCAFLPSSSEHIHLIVSVEDTGEGIPVEAQSRIFTPFMHVGPSTTRKYGGTGIGLSISKCLVGLMNGEIGFVSILKVGTTFTFTAVFANGSSNVNEFKSQKISNHSNTVSLEFQGITTLVVDPGSVRAKVSRYHVHRLGIHIEVVSDMNQAFSSINNGNGVINVVLIEEEVWDRESSLFVNGVRKIVHPPKFFILSNSIDSSKTINETCTVYTPCVIMKPLRASMLAASLQRAMGVGKKENPRNGEQLRSLLLGRKILIIDDSFVNLKVAAGALKKYGADMVCAESGEKAIKLLTPPHEFDACFMNIQMPEMDGFEATRRIRDKERNFNNSIQMGDKPALVGACEKIPNWHVPILAMTADVFQTTHEECLEWMDMYLNHLKPNNCIRKFRT